MDFLGIEHDGEFKNSAARHLLICTTPRTGGHALCEALGRAGLGIPMEYFNPDFMVPLQQRWLGVEVRNYTTARTHIIPYGKALEARRSRNSILGIKVFPSQYRLYSEAFPARKADVDYIWLSRGDKVAQTISFAATLVTHKPFDNGKALRFMPRIGALTNTKMLQIFNWLEKQEEYWRELFSRIDPQRVVRLGTEQFLAQTWPTIDILKMRLGFENDAATIQGWDVLNGSRYQQDFDLKVQLNLRFRAILEARAQSAPERPIAELRTCI